MFPFFQLGVCCRMQSCHPAGKGKDVSISVDYVKQPNTGEWEEYHKYARNANVFLRLLNYSSIILLSFQKSPTYTHLNMWKTGYWNIFHIFFTEFSSPLEIPPPYYFFKCNRCQGTGTDLQWDDYYVVNLLCCHSMIVSQALGCTHRDTDYIFIFKKRKISNQRTNHR